MFRFIFGIMIGIALMSYWEDETLTIVANLKGKVIESLDGIEASPLSEVPEELDEQWPELTDLPEVQVQPEEEETNAPSWVDIQARVLGIPVPWK